MRRCSAHDIKGISIFDARSIPTAKRTPVALPGVGMIEAETVAQFMPDCTCWRLVQRDFKRATCYRVVVTETGKRRSPNGVS